MDPIHPILPQPLNVPPVMPAPSVGRINRDGRRDGKPGQEARAKAARQRGEASAESRGEDGSARHVDITA